MAAVQSWVEISGCSPESGIVLLCSFRILGSKQPPDPLLMGRELLFFPSVVLTCLCLYPMDEWLCFPSPSSLKLFLRREKAREGSKQETRMSEPAPPPRRDPLPAWITPFEVCVQKWLMSSLPGLKVLLPMKEGSGKWVVLHAVFSHPPGCLDLWAIGSALVFPEASREAHGKNLCM